MAAPKPIAALLLAAGRSTRMAAAARQPAAGAEASNKLLADIAGRPVVWHAATALLATSARPLIVVTGHAHGDIAAALDGLDVRLIVNDRYRDGMATSLAAGIAEIPAGTPGVLVALADMPCVRSQDIARIIAAFADAPAGAIIVPAQAGRRGHPVLWDACYGAELAAISGDKGGREVMARHAGAVREVALDDDGILIDVDTPAALELARARKAAR